MARISGVDLPNANTLIVMDADHFGLSQLYQIRGRVGRSDLQSYCILSSNTKSQETRARLDIMCQTNDGFVIAEKDLQIRGPGEFLGTRQSGLPDMIIADIVNDSKKIDLLLVKLVFFMAFWHGNAELILRYIRTCIKMRNDKARFEMARILWPDVPRLVNLYERNYETQQELYDFTKQAYQTTVDDTRQFYNESVKEIEKKHNSIERYKELIRTGQLQPFKKK